MPAGCGTGSDHSNGGFEDSAEGYGMVGMTGKNGSAVRRRRRRCGAVVVVRALEAGGVG